MTTIRGPKKTISLPDPPPQEVLIGGTPFSFKNWELTSLPSKEEKPASMDNYSFEVMLDNVIWWDTLTVSSKNKTCTVLDGPAIPVADLLARIPSVFDFNAMPFPGESLYHVIFRDDEWKRWTRNGDRELIAALLAIKDGGIIPPLHDWLEERQDPRAPLILESRNFEEVCFALKYGVSYTRVVESIRQVANSFESAMKAMQRTFMTMTEELTTGIRTFANFIEENSDGLRAPGRNTSSVRNCGRNSSKARRGRAPKGD